MNNAVTKATRDFSGQKNPFFGHLHTHKSRRKISETQRLRYQKVKELLHLNLLNVKSLNETGDTPAQQFSEEGESAVAD